MDGAPARPEGGRIPWGMIGMIGLVVVIEAAVARHGLDLMATSTSSWVHSARAAHAAAPGCAVLCLGDSLVKHGMMPRLVESRTGRRAYNLSVCAAQPPVTYFLLRRALAAGARPSAVVVDFKPDLLAGGPRYAVRNWQEFLTPGEALDLSWASGDAAFLATTLLGRLVPSVRARLEVRQSVLAALRGETASPRALTRLHWRNWTINRGAQFTPKNPSFTGRVTPEVHKGLASHVWWCHKLNAAYVRRFLALARTRQVRVYWLLPPIAPELQARRDQTGADAGHTRFVRSLQEEFPDLVVLDGRRARYGHELFVDAAHLDGQGATTLTLDVAEVLQGDREARPVGATRWVHLPLYRDRPAGIALEDINQSSLAVEAGAGEIRR